MPPQKLGFLLVSQYHKDFNKHYSSWILNERIFDFAWGTSSIGKVVTRFSDVGLFFFLVHRENRGGPTFQPKFCNARRGYLDEKICAFGVVALLKASVAMAFRNLCYDLVHGAAVRLRCKALTGRQFDDQSPLIGYLQLLTLASAFVCFAASTIATLL